MNKLINILQLELALKKAVIVITEEQLEDMKQSLFKPKEGEEWEINGKVCTVTTTNVNIINGDKFISLTVVTEPDGKLVAYTDSIFEQSKMLNKA